MSKCKTKAIQTDLDTFRHNQAHSKPCVNLVCSELWYIRNPNIFKTRNIHNPGIFRILVYWKLWHIQKPKADSDIYDVKHLRWKVLWKKLTENSFAILAYCVLYFMKKNIIWSSYSKDTLCKKFCAQGYQRLWNVNTPIDTFK